MMMINRTDECGDRPVCPDRDILAHHVFLARKTEHYFLVLWQNEINRIPLLAQKMRKRTGSESRHRVKMRKRTGSKTHIRKLTIV